MEANTARDAVRGLPSASPSGGTPAPGEIASAEVETVRRAPLEVTYPRLLGAVRRLTWVLTLVHPTRWPDPARDVALGECDPSTRGAP